MARHRTRASWGVPDQNPSSMSTTTPPTGTSSTGESVPDAGPGTQRDLEQGRRGSQPTYRTLRSLLLRVLVCRVVMFGVATTILGLAHVLSVDPSAQTSARQVPTWRPSWTAADRRAHPRCVPSASWPEGKPAAFIVVYSFRDHVRRKVTFADAWARNHNATEVDDIWVLGVCPDRALTDGPRVSGLRLLPKAGRASDGR